MKQEITAWVALTVAMGLREMFTFALRHGGPNARDYLHAACVNVDRLERRAPTHEAPRRARRLRDQAPLSQHRA